MNFSYTTGTPDKAYAHRAAYPLKPQALRALQWADRIIIQQRGHVTEQEAQTYTKLNHDTKSKLIEALRTEVPDEVDLNKFLNENHKPHHLAVKLKLYHTKMEQEWKSTLLNAREKEAQEANTKQIREDTQGLRLFKRIKAPPAEALTYTTKKEMDGDREITRYITDPKEVNEVVRQRWAQEVYDGNGTDEDIIINNLLVDYADTLVRSPTKFEIDDITGAELLEINNAAGHSAGGLDGWTTEDMALFTPKAAQALADLFNAIEKGARWPKIMEQGKAAFLAKDATQKADCMKYRILTLLPLFYRRWAGIRPWRIGSAVGTRMKSMQAPPPMGRRTHGREQAWSMSLHGSKVRRWREEVPTSSSASTRYSASC